jgi:hypothetical protein
MRVGYGKHALPRQAVQQCQRMLGDVRPWLLIAFAGGKHDPAQILRALREAFGDDVPVVGGSAAGVIGREVESYSGLELGLIAFHDPATTPQILVTDGLRTGEVEAGRELGERIATVAADNAVVLILYDSVRHAAPLQLHPASAIVEGLQQGLHGRRLHLVGGGMLTDMNLSDSWVFDGRGVAKHTAVALVFPPTVVAHTEILHGCRPISSFMEITRVAGAEVFELDGEPALSVIERMLGIPLGSSQMQQLSLIATLGQKQGDPFAPFSEDRYVNRLILRTDATTGSVTLFEPDFRRGTRVQIMSRDNELMLASVREGVARLNSRIAGTEPMLGLYIDCAGRASGRSGAVIEEARLVRDRLDPSVTLLGFYSGVEIAPFDGVGRSLDWTGVLTVMTRAA